MTGKDIMCVLAAYLLGGICTGYYLVRLKTGLDIRKQGSGGIGARNVGRVLGRSGFLITSLGDALKGAAAVLLAQFLELSAPAISVVLVVVIAGHIWPPTLQFRGGRGIATAIGAYLVYDFNLTVLLLATTSLLMLFRRSLVLSGLVAFLLLPVITLLLDFPLHAVASVAAVSLIILFAHRERLKNAFTKQGSKRKS